MVDALCQTLEGGINRQGHHEFMKVSPESTADKHCRQRQSALVLELTAEKQYGHGDGDMQPAPMVTAADGAARGESTCSRKTQVN